MSEYTVSLNAPDNPLTRFNRLKTEWEADSELLKIITIYEPEESQWIEFEKRR